jgi:hypothetical protein
MVPGAADGIVDDKTFAQRAPVMGAPGADGEKFVAAANEEHRLIVDMTTQHRAVGKGGELHSRTEVWSFELHIAGAHIVLRKQIGGVPFRTPTDPHLMQT